ncbi:MAG: hypothetical protein V1754_04715, partial [Pseudomonadota bacterium]
MKMCAWILTGCFTLLMACNPGTGDLVSGPGGKADGTDAGKRVFAKISAAEFETLLRAAPECEGLDKWECFHGIAYNRTGRDKDLGVDFD